jgi:hypothetical protein
MRVPEGRDTYPVLSSQVWGKGGGGAVQSISDSMPDFALKLLQYVKYKHNNILIKKLRPSEQV